MTTRDKALLTIETDQRLLRVSSRYSASTISRPEALARIICILQELFEEVSEEDAERVLTSLQA